MAAISIKSTLILVTALFLIIMGSTTPALAQGGILSGLNIVQATLLGRVACTASGNPIPGVPTIGVRNVPVVLTCNRTSSSSVTQVLTNPAGFFTFVIGLLDAALFDPSNCTISVALPLVNCTLSPPTGTLQAIPRLFNIVPAAMGLVAQFLGGAFSLLPAL